MNVQIEESKIDDLRAYYESGGLFRDFCDWAASRKNDARWTTTDRLQSVLHAENRSVVQLLKELERLGCGRFVVGRRGHKSRIEWYFSLRSIGAVSRGEREDIEEADPELEADGVAFEGAESNFASAIFEAKEALANRLGLKPEAIEISVRF